MLDWFAAIFELSGAWLLGNRRKLGFFFNIIACIIWAIVGVRTEVWGLLLICSTGIFINVRNILRWRKDNP